MADELNLGGRIHEYRLAVIKNPEFGSDVDFDAACGLSHDIQFPLTQPLDLAVENLDLDAQPRR